MTDFKEVVKKINEKKSKVFLDKVVDVFDLFFNKWKDLREKNGYKVHIENHEDLVPKIDFGSLKIPTSFKIENPEEIAEYIIIPKVDIPSTIKISNLSELAKYLEVREKVQIPKDFSIKNLKDIPQTVFPENLKKLSLEKTEKVLELLVKEVSAISKKKTSDEVFIKNKKATEYIPVRIVDKKGKDWMEAFGSGLVSFPSKFGVTNIEGYQINPATEEKQDDMISAINGIGGTTTYNYIQSDEDVTYKYYGFASDTGWKIKRKTLATGIWEVASATGDYDTAWTNRATHSYNYF